MTSVVTRLTRLGSGCVRVFLLAEGVRAFCFAVFFAPALRAFFEDFFGDFLLDDLFEDFFFALFFFEALRAFGLFAAFFFPAFFALRFAAMWILLFQIPVGEPLLLKARIMLRGNHVAQVQM